MNTSENDYGQLMAAAHKGKQPKPTVDSELTLSDAYQIQIQMIELLDSPIVGYKSALSSLPAQAAFGVAEPLLGVLLENSAVQDGFDLAEMVVPMIEVEMGYELGLDVTSAVTTDDFVAIFTAMHIAVDLAEVGYTAKPRAVDLVSGNSAAGRFIKGPAIGSAVDSVGPNHVQVKLLKEDEQVNEATSGDIGDQQTLAIWLVNKALSLGYPVKKGMLVMTGSLGKILPAQAGQYTACYESEGQILAELVVHFTKG